MSSIHVATTFSNSGTHTPNHICGFCAVFVNTRYTQLHIHGKFIYYIAGIKQKQKMGREKGEVRFLPGWQRLIQAGIEECVACVCRRTPSAKCHDKLIIDALFCSSPIRKLCPLKCYAEAVSASCSACTKQGRERHEPSWKIKSGPGVGGLMTMYARMAATGHKMSPYTIHLYIHEIVCKK